MQAVRRAMSGRVLLAMTGGLILLAACGGGGAEPPERPPLLPAPSGATAAPGEAAPLPPATTATASAAATANAANGGPPAGLSLPVLVEDLAVGGDFVSPFGVVRWSQDRPEYGHSGIDLPLRLGAPLLAVADATVLAVTPTVDHRPGSVVTLLLSEGARTGEGWGFIYEHVTLEPGVVEGSAVRRGQPFATSPLNPREANNHLQLSYLFNEYRYYRDHTCWVDRLEPDAAAALRGRFDEFRSTAGFLSGWRNATEEGQHQYRGLLDETRYPGGPRLCYPQGTDVRTAG